MSRIVVATKAIASFANLIAVTDLKYWLAKHQLDSISWCFLLYPLSSSAVKGLGVVDNSGVFCKLGSTCCGLHVCSMKTLETRVVVKGLLVFFFLLWKWKLCGARFSSSSLALTWDLKPRGEQTWEELHRCDFVWHGLRCMCADLLSPLNQSWGCCWLRFFEVWEYLPWISCVFYDDSGCAPESKVWTRRNPWSYRW
jgi:hypothetical protein